MPILSKAATEEFDSPLERLLASVANLRQQPTSKGAHFYRTSLRRFQAWSNVFRPHMDAEQEKALNFLHKLRKATGKLRDSEIHLELLDNISATRPPERTKLAKKLKARRKSSRKKLKLLLCDSMVGSIWPALRVLGKSPAQTDSPSVIMADGAQLALEEYRSFVQRRGQLSQEYLHEYRLQCKQFRYTAELSPATPERELLD
jgi:CHAD domain-containing protein